MIDKANACGNELRSPNIRTYARGACGAPLGAEWLFKQSQTYNQEDCTESQTSQCGLECERAESVQFSTCRILDSGPVDIKWYLIT